MGRRKSKNTGIGIELLGDKLQKAAATQLGEEKIKELMARPSDDLKALISGNTVAMSESKKSMESNVNYIKAKDVCDTFKSALRDSNKPLKTAIDVAVAILKDRKEKPVQAEEKPAQ